jgi:ankyrin repeat protein
MSHLLNEPDKFGCTPLHYASKQGQLGTIRELLQLGAQLSAKNNKQQSALHFAAR